VMSLLPAEVAMLSCWQAAQTPETIEFCTRYLLPILQAAAPTNSAAAGAALANILRENMEVRAGAMGMALTVQPAGEAGLDWVQVYRVRDAAAARAAQRKAVAMGVEATSMLWSEAGAGRMKYDASIAKHGGVEIDRITVDLEEGASPSSGAAARNLFGSNMVTQVAFTGQFGLSATGSRGEENIRRLISLVRKPPAGPVKRPRFDAATAGFPRRVNGVFFMQVEDYFKIATHAMAPPVAAEGGRLHELLERVQADIAGCFTLAKGTVMAEVVVPLEKLLELSHAAAQEAPTP